jgi:hypothetical protein
MKHFFLLAVVAFASSSTYARRCVPDMQGNRIFENRCEVIVTGTNVQGCRVYVNTNDPFFMTGGAYPGNHPRPLPGMYFPPYAGRPWERITPTKVADACDITLEDCKYFAFRELDKFSYRTQCGDLSVGRSVEYRYVQLHRDGSVADEVSGRMRK